MMHKYYEDNIPQCTTQIQRPDLCEKTEFTDKNEFIKELNEIISSDCWACVLDGEILWNDFAKSLNFKQKINESVIRDYIIENTYVIANTLCENGSSVLDLYMYGKKTVLFRVSFVNNSYIISFYN